MTGLKVSTLELGSEYNGLGGTESVEEPEFWVGCSMKGERTTSSSILGDFRKEREISRRI